MKEIDAVIEKHADGCGGSKSPLGKGKTFAAPIRARPAAEQGGGRALAARLFWRLGQHLLGKTENARFDFSLLNKFRRSSGHVPAARAVPACIEDMRWWGRKEISNPLDSFCAKGRPQVGFAKRGMSA
jgi:hypothetical protein